MGNLNNWWQSLSEQRMRELANTRVRVSGWDGECVPSHLMERILSPLYMRQVGMLMFR